MGISAIVGGVVAAVGVGTSIMGMSKQQKGYDQMQQGYNTEAQAASQQAGYSKAITGDEMQQDQVRRQAMELDARRNTLQVVRQAQSAKSMAIASATAQGAGYNASGSSSGLQGGLAQVQGDTGFNLMGIKQNLAMGENMFDLNANISQQKIGIADTQTLMAQGQGQVGMGQGMVGQGSGLMALGGQLVSSAGTIGNLAGNFQGTRTPAVNPASNNPMWGGGVNGTNSSGWF